MVMDCVFHITSGLKGVPEALVLLTKLSMVDNQASRGPHWKTSDGPTEGEMLSAWWGNV